MLDKIARGAVTLTIMLGLVAMTMAWAGCAQVDNVVERGKAIVVDCTKKEAAQAITEFGPLVEATLLSAVDSEGHVSFDPIKHAAQRWTADVGGCIAADVVSRLLTPPPRDPLAPHVSELQIDRIHLLADFALFKAQRFGGVQFKLANGGKL